VLDHVAFPVTANGHTSMKRAQVLARAALGRVGLLGCADQSLDRLSLGECFRVELARALVRSPRLLLVDEPPVLSSPSEGHDLQELLRSLGEEWGLAVLVASGDLSLVQMARRGMSLSRGELRSNEPRGTVLPFPDRYTNKGTGVARPRLVLPLRWGDSAGG
jgi:ABC-type ATPase involved in cell division